MAILDFTDIACRELSRIGAVINRRATANMRSGIVSFEMPGRDPQELRKHCLTQGVALNCRGGRLRLSAHAYNDVTDLERLLVALRVG